MNNNQIERRLEALEESMGVRSTVPRGRIQILYYKPGVGPDGKPVLVGERIIEFGGEESKS